MWRFEIRNCFVNTEVISKEEFRLNLAVCSFILSNISQLSRGVSPGKMLAAIRTLAAGQMQGTQITAWCVSCLPGILPADGGSVSGRGNDRRDGAHRPLS